MVSEALYQCFCVLSAGAADPAVDADAQQPSVRQTLGVEDELRTCFSVSVVSQYIQVQSLTILAILPPIANPRADELPSNPTTIDDTVQLT